ncbi:MAG: hypothetical protein JW874_08370 [Spirochaetales bacterium]|nr:hypothetical protein [Spirochaetales bacterium]
MIIPSVDLQDKKAVQLRQGRVKMLEDNDPVGLAGRFSFYSELAVIDLDAAIRKDGVNNEDIISGIAEIADCRVGGGIRSLDKARRIIGFGVGKIIIGTSAFKDGKINRAFLESLAGELGREKIILAVDTYEGEIVTHGWRNKSGIILLDIVEGLEPYASELLFTCVEREGMLEGAALDQVQALRQATALELTAAGGITTLAEIAELSALMINCQLGMSIYTGRLQLDEAVLASLDWSEGEIPVRVNDREKPDQCRFDRNTFSELLSMKEYPLHGEEGTSSSGPAVTPIRKIRNAKDNKSVSLFI